MVVAVFAASSCHKALKNVEDYFPKVKTVSATVQTDGSVLVKGEVESTGNTEIEYAGACFSLNSDPKMDEHQLMANSSGSFSVVFPADMFVTDSTYYFRAWAANGNGYAVGSVIKLQGIIAASVTPPCSQTMNTVNIGGGQPTATYYSVTSPTESLGHYSFTGTSSGGPTVHFEFGSAITTGIYTTSNGSPGAGQVYVDFYSGFTSGALNSGSSVYVNTVSPGVYDITICNAPWIYSSSTFYFDTRLTVPY
jgi:hypothetical protein